MSKVESFPVGFAIWKKPSEGLASTLTLFSARKVMMGAAPLASVRKSNLVDELPSGLVDTLPEPRFQLVRIEMLPLLIVGLGLSSSMPGAMLKLALARFAKPLAAVVFT